MARRTNAQMTAETTAKILRATISCLAELGYAGTTLALIASKVGISSAALLYHYQNKDALMVAAIECIFRDLNDYYRRDVNESSQVRDRVLTILKKAYAWTQSSDHTALIELSLAARRSESLGALVSAALLAHNQAFDAAWEALLMRAGIAPERSGLIRDFGVSMLRGMAVSRLLKRDDASIDRQMEMLTQIVLAETAPPR
jgi:AcrR family transcriptional regulator